MQANELKSLVEAGLYKPDPARIAAAMLERRGVRDLLVPAAASLNGTMSLNGSTGRNRARQAVPPRAA